MTISIHQTPSPIILGRQTIPVVGFNPDIDIGVVEDLWPIGGLIDFPSVAGQVSIVSSSAVDTSAGTGAQAVIIFGIDDSFVEFTEIVALNGTTPVVTVSSDFIHVQSAAIVAAGTGLENAGTITFTVGSGICNGMAPGKNITQSGAVIIPKADRLGTKAHLINVFALAGKAQGATATIALVTIPAATGLLVESLDIPLTTNGGTFSLYVQIPITFDTGDKLIMRVIDSSANNVEVSGAFELAWF